MARSTLSVRSARDKDEFFKWIDRAISAKQIRVVYLRYSPFFNKTRDHSRFPEIFKKLGLPYPATRNPLTELFGAGLARF